MNETYFEHAYLARYLGLLLVEGEDLTVRDDGVFIRTISGLRRAEVLLRRLDADFADPLELNAASRLGVAGLVQAVRDGNVVIVNALGAGLVEARAMLAFLPALAQTVLGSDLAVPNIATWWLGRADIREQMSAKLDSMVDRPGIHRLPAQHSARRWNAGRSRSTTAQRRDLMRVDPGSRRRLCGAGSRHACRPRRCGATAGCSRGRSRCACFSPRSASTGGSCRAVSCASPRAPMRARSACNEAPQPPTPGCCRMRRSRKRRCCRHRSGWPSSGRPARCPAGPPTICSGSGAIWSARKRRCGWFAP